MKSNSPSNNFYPDLVRALQSHLNKKLLEAIRLGYSMAVNTLIMFKANVNVKTKTKGLTPLMVAAKAGNLPALCLLLDAHADVNMKNAKKTTPLMLASRKGHEKVVAELIFRHPECINETDHQGKTALMFAAKFGYLNVVNRLLSDCIPPHYRAKVCQTDDRGKTALMFSAQHGHIEVVKKIASMDPEGINRTDKYARTALMLAAQFAHTAVVSELAQRNPKGVDDQDKNGMTALMLATQQKHKGVINTLLHFPANTNICSYGGYTALRFAAIVGSIKIFSALLPFCSFDSRVLIDAVKQDRTKIAHFMLTQKLVDINTINEYGMTALMIAVQNKRTSTVKMLISDPHNKKLIINQTNQDGINALMFAVQIGDPCIVKLLLDAQFHPAIDTNIPTPKMGITPLMIAAELNEVEIAQALIKAGAKVNTQNKSGFTALMLAAKNGHGEMVTLLLKERSTLNIFSTGGRSALALAEQYHRVEVVNIIIDFCKKNRLSPVRHSPNYLPQNAYKKQKIPRKRTDELALCHAMKRSLHM